MRGGRVCSAANLCCQQHTGDDGRGSKQSRACVRAPRGEEGVTLLRFAHLRTLLIPDRDRDREIDISVSPLQLLFPLFPSVAAAPGCALAGGRFYIKKKTVTQTTVSALLSSYPYLILYRIVEGLVRENQALTEVCAWPRGKLP